MYAAKYAGRNRVGIDDPASSPHVLSSPPSRSVPAAPLVGGELEPDPKHAS
jgi:hypothetical protein